MRKAFNSACVMPAPLLRKQKEHKIEKKTPAKKNSMFEGKLTRELLCTELHCIERNKRINVGRIHTGAFIHTLTDNEERTQSIQRKYCKNSLEYWDREFIKVVHL